MPQFPTINKPEGHPDDQDSKRMCVHCKEWKPLEKYARKHSKSPVRSWTCIRCTSRMARERAQEKEQGQLPPDTETERWCPDCNQYRPFDEFSFDRAGEKRKRRCNPCRSKARREKYQATVWDQVDARSLYPADTETERWCPKCETFKPFGQFYKYGRRSKLKDKLYRICKLCFIEQARLNKLANPQWTSKILTKEEFEAQLEAQGGVCYLCGREQTVLGRGGEIRRMAIDHDHEHCKPGCPECFRKLLCDPCNLGLGNFQHDPELLEKAAAYIREHRDE